MPASPAAVLFDMDGTLVDFEHLWLRATAEFAAGLGRTLTDNDLHEVLGHPVEHIAAHLQRTTRTCLTVHALAERLNDAVSSRLTDTVVLPRPGVLTLLAELHDAAVPAALVSASPRNVVDLVLNSLGDHWFAVALAAEDTQRTKPDPAPCLAAAERLGLDPAACVAVEGTPAGVASAHTAGCPVLAVPSAVPIAAADRITVLASLEQADLALLSTLAAQTTADVSPGYSEGQCVANEYLAGVALTWR